MGQMLLQSITWLLCLSSLVHSHEDQSHRRQLRAPSGTGLECLIVIEDIMYENDEGEHTVKHTYACSPDDLMLYSLPDWLEERYEEELKGTGDAVPVYMFVPGGALPIDLDDPILVPEHSHIRFSHAPSGRRRRLFQDGVKTQGTSSVLVVRIVAKDTEPSLSVEELGNRAFGDGPTLQGVYKNCSNGLLNLEQGVGDGTDIANGVGTVTVSLNAHGSSRRQMESAATSVINWKYGIANYDHIMFCLPPGTNDPLAQGTDWVATGLKFFYRTTFNDHWCGSLSALVHELGHNLGLDHSGQGASQYEDQSCMMGYSYNLVYSPQMCFNGHKHWVLGWYDQRKKIVQPSAGGPFVGRLVAFVDYDKMVHGEHAILNVRDLYIQFNRAKSYNEQVLDYRNLVTVVQGTHPSVPSYLLASLSVGQNFTYDGIVIEACHFSNFDNPEDGKDFVEMSIYLESHQSRCSPPTQPPSEVPTYRPSRSPSASPTTSSPSLNPTETLRPTPFSTPLPSVSPTNSPSLPVPTPSPSDFPTRSPSVSPTFLPSYSPTDPPSRSPSNRPTNLPSFEPTKEPSREPTYDTCDDHPSKKFWVDFLSQYQACVFLKARENLQALLCQPDHDSGAYDICPETCGKCTDECEDQPTSSFLVDGVRRNCLYISLRPLLIEQECKVGREAWDICRETCSNCIEGPSAAPTPKPTTAYPTMTALPTRVTQKGDPCDDDFDYQFSVSDGSFRTCRWLSMASEEDKSVLCRPNDPSNVHRYCKESCGRCSDTCVDDPAMVFPDSDGINRGCAWLNINAAEATARCVMGSELWERCAETCGNCPPAPTASPAPSETPTTLAPVTPAPTTGFPTLFPTSFVPKPVTGDPPCNVCGFEGSRITKPDGLVSYPGFAEQITCRQFADFGERGGIDPDFCPYIYPYAVDCGCSLVTTSPTVTGQPSRAPVTAAPVSARETTPPETSVPSLMTPAPVTLSPLTTPFPHSGNRACFLCGSPESHVTFLSAFVELTDVGRMTCSVVEAFALEGFFDDFLCADMKTKMDPCVCSGVPTPAPTTAAPIPPSPAPTTPAPQHTPFPFTGYRSCNVCKYEGSEIGNLTASVVLPEFGKVTCHAWQLIGSSGFISTEDCEQVDLYNAPCECTYQPSAAPITPEPTPAPVTPVPTPFPTTLGPQHTPAPQTGNRPCFICGDEESSITIDNVIVNAPSIDPVSCIILDALGQAAFIDDLTCEELPPYVNEPCGCTDPPTSSPGTPAPMPPTPTPTLPSTPGPTTNPTLNPTPGPTTNPTPNPTPGPTTNPTPNPTPGPTTNPTPNPTPGPTVQPVVQASAAPAGNMPCNVCGFPGSEVTKEGVMVSVSGVGEASCSALQALGQSGFIDSDVCATIPQQISACECSTGPIAAPITLSPITAATPAPATGMLPCNICGVEGSRVTIFDASVSTPLLSSTSCDILQILGDGGLLDVDVCESLPVVTQTTCGCTALTTPVPSPSPVEFGPCDICGDSGLGITIGTALITLPGQPPVTCNSVQTMATQDLIPVDQCSLYVQQVTATCGCSDSATDAPVSSPREAPTNNSKLLPARSSPCEICGEGKRISNLDVQVQVPFRETPESCAYLDFIGRRGLISPTDCASMPPFLGPCGCT